VALPTNIMDNLSYALANAKAAMEVLGSSVGGGKQCERMAVGTERYNDMCA